MEIRLYFSPGTCARVPLIALEEANVPFETVLIKFAIGEHKSPDYRHINPKGKVPTLEVDGFPLTENVAILGFLSTAFPGAELFPPSSNAFGGALAVADLSWCASTIHPIVTRLVLPQLFCDTEDGRVRAWQQAAAAMQEQFILLDERLATRPWMLGEWSVVDAYVYWIWDQSLVAGFDGSPYRHLADHALRMQQRPSVRRALAREQHANTWLKENGFDIQLPPPPLEGK